VFFGTHVITQTQDIMTGVLVGNDAKETKIQKYKRYTVEIFVTKSEASGPLQNGFWLPFCAKF
jgi:hypothetical protein